MRIGIVINPATAAEMADDVISEIGVGHEIETVETTEDDPGFAQTRQLVDESVDIVVACGGDGTVRACAEALLDTEVPLGVAPAGTGNLLALNLEISDQAADIAHAITNGVDKVIDVGVVNDEAFLIIAGAGFDARIMEETSREAKDRFGPLAYVATALRHVGDGAFTCHITTDDHSTTLKVATILAGNLGRLQGGVEVFPDAEPSDGELDVLAIAASTPLEWLTAAAETLSDGDRSEHLHRQRVHRVTIEFDEPIPYEIDGEERPETNLLRVEVRPSALRVRVARQGVVQ